MMERRQGRRAGGGRGVAGEGSGGGGGEGGEGGGKGGAVRSKASWSSCFCCLDTGEWEKRKKKRDTRSRRRRSKRRYDREVADLGSLLYKASMSSSGRTASSGSLSDGRSRGKKAELGRSSSRGSGRRRDARLAGGWDSRSLHAVKQLHETLRDMPVGERDRLLREDLLLLSPIINELCPKLPETHYTFVLPYADDVDVSANRYLGGLLDSIKRRQGVVVVPLLTTGDGSCLVHAASRGIWGVELFSDMLRHKLCEEISDNKSWYESRISKEEYQEALEHAQRPRQFLSTIHIVALAHVIRRPIILYASEEAVQMFGCGFYGVAGFFGPLRYDVNTWYSWPIAIAWNSSRHNHFVPLVWTSSQKPPRWPVQSAHSGNNPDKASDPFRVPSEYRRILARKNNGIILEPPRFVRRLVEKVRARMVCLQGHLLARSMESGSSGDRRIDSSSSLSSRPMKVSRRSSMGSLSSCSSSSSMRTGLVSSATSLNSDMSSISVSGGQSIRSVSQPAASAPAEQIPNLMDEIPAVSSTSAPVPNLMDEIDMVLSGPSESQVTGDDSTEENIDSSSGFGVGEFALSGMHIPYDPEPEPLESRALSEGCHSQNGNKDLNQRENGWQTPLIGLLHPIRRNPRGKWRSGAIRQPVPGSPTPSLLSVDVELPSGGCILEDDVLSFGGDGCVLVSIPGAKKKTVRVAVGENPYLKADDLVEGTNREERRGGGLVQWTQQRLAASKTLFSSGLRYVDGLVGDYHLRGMSSEMASPKVAAELSANDESDLTDEENESVQSIVGHRSLNGIRTREEADHCRAQNRMLWLALAQQITDRMRTMAVADATVRALQKPLPKDYAQYAIAQPKMTMVATSMLRIMCELRLLRLNPLAGISTGPVEEDNLYKWRAVFEGPAGTPWAGGRYILDIEIPEDYPRKPPSQLRFISRMFHPNIDPRGVPCLDLMESSSGTRGDAHDGSSWRSSSMTVHSDETPLSLSTAASSPATSTPFRETGTSLAERQGQLLTSDVRGQGAGTRRELAALSQRGDDCAHHQQNLSSASGASTTVTPKASAADAHGEFLQPGVSDYANLPSCHSVSGQESSHMFVSTAHDSTTPLSHHSGLRGASCLPLPLLPPPAERHSRPKEVPTGMRSIGTVSERDMLQAASTEVDEDTWDVDSSHASPSSQSPLQTPSFTPCSSPSESFFPHRDCEGSMTPDACVSASGPNASGSTLAETMAIRFTDGGGKVTVPKTTSTAPLMQPEVVTTSWVVGRGGARQVGQVSFNNSAMGAVPATHVVQIMKSRAGLSSVVQLPSAPNRKPGCVESEVGKGQAACRERAVTGRGGESRCTKVVKENGSSGRSRDWMEGQSQLCPPPEFAKAGAGSQKQQATSVEGRCRDVDISTGPNHAVLRGGELVHQTAVSPLLPMQREPSSQANLRIPLVQNGEMDEGKGRVENHHPLHSPLRSSISPLRAARMQPSVEASDVAASVSSHDTLSTDRADVVTDNLRMTPCRACTSGRLSTDTVSLANFAAGVHREWTGCCSLTSILLSVQMLFWEANPENAVNTAAASVYQNNQLEWVQIVHQCAADSLRGSESCHSLGVSSGDPLL